MTRRKASLRKIAASVACLELAFQIVVYAQTPNPAASPTPPACENEVSPGVIQLIPDTANPNNKLRLARKRFYLFSRPFNVASSVDLSAAPSRRSYYTSIKTSEQFIRWLEANNCDTVYCRELNTEEVTCKSDAACVPEFVDAYSEALRKLNGNQELARKAITNYQSLSSHALRVGFYEAKTAWLKAAVDAIEKAQGNNSKIRSAIADKDGIAFFYDLCPGTYYVSNIAPINIDSVDLLWETAKPIKVEGPPDVNRAIVVTLAFPPGKDKKNYFIGKPVAEILKQKTSTQ